jgi:DNA-binding response OmpR family regulator
MKQKKILVVEDEKDINELVSYNLKKQGFIPESAYNGAEALKKLKKGGFDLVILDLMLPEIDGLELCRILRADKALSSVPIIMLTARSEEIDRVLGLEMGADDYVVKPFSTRELMARVKAVLRRAPAAGRDEGAGKIRKTGDIEIDLEKFLVKRKGKPVTLSAMEFRLLRYLAERPGKVFSRDFLLDSVWGNESFVEPRTVDVHVRRLREKIEDDPSMPVYLLTKRGVGYYFSEEAARHAD